MMEQLLNIEKNSSTGVDTLSPSMKHFLDLNKAKMGGSEWGTFFSDVLLHASKDDQKEFALSVAKNVYESRQFDHTGFVKSYLQFVSCMQDNDTIMAALERLVKVYRKYPHLCLSNDAQLVLLRWSDREKNASIKSEIHTVLAASNINCQRKRVGMRKVS